MVAPTLTQVRTALGAQIQAAIPGLRVNPVVPGQVNPPALIIRPTRGVIVNYQETQENPDGTFATDWTLDLLLLVSFADNEAAQEQIDPYLSPAGASSVWAAVHADQTLGGTVSYAYVDRATGYGSLDYAGVSYLGCTLIAMVGAP